MTERILMCPPDYYGVEYEINPWMNTTIKPDHKLATQQWQNLYDTIKNNAKAEIELIEPQKGLPDMVFTANAALLYNKKAIISKFKFKERQPEEDHFAAWFEKNGYKVFRLPDYMPFEGAGDALFIGDTLFSGYVPRTDISSHIYISTLLKIKILSIELRTQNFYHLDTCFCPLENGYVMYYPQAFDEYANNVIEANVPKEKRIHVTEEEASYFTCNAVNIGNSVITNLTTDRIEKELDNKGFRLYQVDLSEFMKAGGSAKCLTLKL